MGQPAYLPQQPRPLRILRPGPPPWTPLLLVGGLLFLAAVGIAVIVLTNPSL